VDEREVHSDIKLTNISHHHGVFITKVMKQMVLTLESQCKGTNTPSSRTPVVDEERLKPG